MTSNDVGTASQSPVAGSPTAVSAVRDQVMPERARSPGASTTRTGESSVRCWLDRIVPPSLRPRLTPPKPRTVQVRGEMLVRVMVADPAAAPAVAPGARPGARSSSTQATGAPAADEGGGDPGAGVVAVEEVGGDVCGDVCGDVEDAGGFAGVEGVGGPDVGEAGPAVGLGGSTPTPPWNEHAASSSSTADVTGRAGRSRGRTASSCPRGDDRDVPTILLADDETAITDNLAPLLSRAGFDVVVAHDGEEALARVRARRPDLVVLDVMMPRLDGRAVLRTLRREKIETPVILLTQVGESSERAMALEEGADDYLNKPFDPQELTARIRAVLRRQEGTGGGGLGQSSRLRSGPVLLDRVSQRVWKGEREVVLTPRATALLAYLMTHPDEVMTRERLLEAVWGWSYQTSTRSVDTRVAELRRELEDDSAAPRLITTVLGTGYRFSGHVERA